MKESVFKVFKNLVITIVMTTISFILAAVIMTYLKSGFDMALYLIQCAIIIPCAVIAYKINDIKYVTINIVMYTITLISLILVTVSEFSINRNIIFFIIIICLSSLCGYFFRKYFIDKV